MQEAERHNRRLFCKKRCPAAAGMDKERQERVHMREAIYNNFIKDERWRYLTDGLQVTLKQYLPGRPKKAQTAPMKASKRFMTSTERLMRQLQKLHSQVLLTF